MKKKLGMPDSFKSLKEIILKEPSLAGIKTSIVNSETILEFYKIFPELQQIVKPIKIENRILFLKVENSVWRSELNLQSKALIEKLNSNFKEERIKAIRFL